MAGLLQRKARLALGGAALAAVCLASAPAWSQTNCPIPKGKADWYESSLVASQRANLNRARSATNFAAEEPFVAAALSQCLDMRDGRLKDSKVKDGKVNGPVQMCIGDASAMLASNHKSDLQRFADADCAFQIAERLAQGDDARASAAEGQARNFDAWGQPGPALAAWKRAVAVKSPDRIRSYAKALAASSPQGRTEADGWYGQLGLLQKTADQYTPWEREALMEWAALRRDRPADAAEIWKRLDTAEANFELGKMEFAKGSDTAATGYFKRARALASGAGSSQANIVSTSLYHLAVLSARASDWSQAAKYAEDSVIGGATYRRLACLTYLASGAKSLSSADGDSSVCRAGAPATGEDSLIYGAYLLRRAQFADYDACKPLKTIAEQNKCVADLNEKVRRLRSDAVDVFSRGRDLPAEDQSKPARFNWLLKPEKEAPELAGLLRSGQGIASILNSPSTDRCDRLKSTPPDNQLDRDFFKTLDLLSCAPTR